MLAAAMVLVSACAPRELAFPARTELQLPVEAVVVNEQPQLLEREIAQKASGVNPRMNARISLEAAIFVWRIAMVQNIAIA